MDHGWMDPKACYGAAVRQHACTGGKLMEFYRAFKGKRSLQIQTTETAKQVSCLSATGTVLNSEAESLPVPQWLGWEMWGTVSTIKPLLKNIIGQRLDVKLIASSTARRYVMLNLVYKIEQHTRTNYKRGYNRKHKLQKRLQPEAQTAGMTIAKTTESRSRARQQQCQAGAHLRASQQTCTPSTELLRRRKRHRRPTTTRNRLTLPTNQQAAPK
jgi:hypothetical protein